MCPQMGILSMTCEGELWSTSPFHDMVFGMSCRTWEHKTMSSMEKPKKHKIQAGFRQKLPFLSFPYI